MILGGMAVAGSPVKMISRGEISRTRVDDLETMRMGMTLGFMEEYHCFCQGSFCRLIPLLA